MRADAPLPTGPEGAFELLFDGERRDAPSLLEGFRRVYGGDWRLPQPEGRPYTYANFVVSRDGRVSFNEPGRLGGGDVSGFSAHDTWLMGLLRARADAVLVGDHTLRLEPGHLWTSAYICPFDAPAFAALREAEGRAPAPLQVFLSLTGDLDGGAAVFQQAALHVVVATTTAGAERAAGVRGAGRLEVLALGEEACDVGRLMTVLHADYGVRTLLCEGGPRVYGSLLRSRVVDDEFLTLSPVVIGAEPGRFRPSLVEGCAFTPETAPRPTLLSLRRAGDHLFLRSRYGAQCGGSVRATPARGCP